MCDNTIRNDKEISTQSTLCFVLKKGDKLTMDEIIKDLNKKRVCDRSVDHKVVIIVRDGCKTLITANLDGTLDIKFEVIPAA